MNDLLDHIMAVMEASFDPTWGESWTRRQVSDALLLGNCSAIVLGPDRRPPDSNEAAAGFLLSRHLHGEEELLLIAVRPEYRRRGIGAELLRQFSDAARKRGATRLFLEMREGNLAENIYIKHGFMPIGRRRNYYNRGKANPVDAITYGRELS